MCLTEKYYAPSENLKLRVHPAHGVHNLVAGCIGFGTRQVHDFPNFLTYLYINEPIEIVPDDLWADPLNKGLGPTGPLLFSPLRQH